MGLDKSVCFMQIHVYYFCKTKTNPVPSILQNNLCGGLAVQDVLVRFWWGGGGLFASALCLVCMWHLRHSQVVTGVVSHTGADQARAVHQYVKMIYRLIFQLLRLKFTFLSLLMIQTLHQLHRSRKGCCPGHGSWACCSKGPFLYQFLKFISTWPSTR